MIEHIHQTVPHHRAVLSVCASFLLLTLVYAAVTPPFEAPDEGSHFLYMHNLLLERALPILEDRDTVFASQSVQRHHPPLYYLIGALLISTTSRADADAYLQRNPLASIGFVTGQNENVYLHPLPAPNGDTGTAITLLRLYSITLATGTLWLTVQIGRLASGSFGVGLLAGVIAASIPSFIHISASINNDNLVTLLFALGTYGCLRVWVHGRIARGDVLILALACAGAALTKITGLALLGVVFGTLLFGAWRRRFSWRTAFICAGVVLLGMALIAGWWYLRNWQLYGDPLALNATRRIWARGGPPQLISLFELKGVSDSFWYVLGHLNIRGPEWLFSLYLPLVALMGVIGSSLALLRLPVLRWRIVFLLGVLLLVFAALLVSSSRINVSQGRILYPALPALATLLALAWHRLLRRWAILPALPLIALAVTAPAALADSFRPAQIVSDLPANVRRIDATAGGLALVAYTLDSPHSTPGDTLRLTLYVQGRHPDNPALFVKALHPPTGAVLGGVDSYPGMMPTAAIREDWLYAVPVDFPINAASSPDLTHAQLQLALGWQIIGADDADNVILPLADANGNPVDNLLVAGATFTNPLLVIPAPPFATDAVFGGAARLIGYALDKTQIAAGEVLNVSLAWQAVGMISEDWTITVGLLNSEGRLIAQQDTPPAGYPTSTWLPAPAFSRDYALAIPPDTPAGDHRLYIGMYRADLSRVQPVGAGVVGDVYMHPTPIMIEAS